MQREHMTPGDAGQAMGRAAQLARAKRLPSESALAILDRICGPYRGILVEFESTDPDHSAFVHPEYAKETDPHTDAALGLLMVEAFSPNGLEDLTRYAPMFGPASSQEKAAYEAWSANVYQPFIKRYGF